MADAPSDIADRIAQAYRSSGSSLELGTAKGGR
ncbi:MAG: hypothetical protein JWN95_803 [Frankiales bacterium]|nr:hypothetical protein [Frankiales bacterium]